METPNRSRKKIRALSAFTLCLALAFSVTAADKDKPAREGVQIAQLADRLRVEINGKLFTEYFFKDVPRPYYYPLLGPDGTPMTRDWPMKNTPGEEHDHPHHRSLWFTHGEVNGHDFWSEQKNFGKIVHTGFDQVKSGKESGIIQSRDNWVANDGTVVCSDTRTLRIHNSGNYERLIDFDITIHADHGNLTFGDTKEGTMALRLTETMRLKPNKDNADKPTGHIVNSEGVRDAATWGKRAKWVDYYGPAAGRIVGVAIFDHPSNPRHPTWWHVRDYGLFAANPFGEHDFENLKEKTVGNLTVPAGRKVTFRYRIYLHEGDERQAKVAQYYEDYVQSGDKGP